MSSAKPVVSLILYALNEERYIREAALSALAQIYSPLEIIFSDDGSTDRTFEIMQQLAADYRGPHKIILNRNEHNVGIGSQINAGWQKSKGELIILANGDDISLPHRVARIVETWMASERKAAAIASAYEVITQDGRLTGRIVSAQADFSDLAASTDKRFGGPGATSMCVSRSCFDRFGPLAPNLILEDGPMNLRSSITGGWCFIDEPLVLYRVHPDNISQAYHPADFKTWRARHRSKARWQMREGEKAFVQMLTDLYSEGVYDQDQKVIEQARINATKRLLQCQLRASYYSDKWSYTLYSWLRSSLELLILVIKTGVKKALPIIEQRNDRWHYRSVLKANKKTGKAE
jgi:glycosyltransferase involved in cell wall biosynthesis